MPRTCPTCRGSGVIEEPRRPWEDAEADTVQLPPIRDTVGIRRQPPPPVVRELTNRAELLEAMAVELKRELAELRDVDEDLACYTCAHPGSHHGGDGCDTWLAGEAHRCGCVADPDGGRS